VGWVVKVPPRPLFPQKRDPVRIVQDAGWASGPVWTGAIYLARTGIRSPYRPAPSESLYRLSYRDLEFAEYQGKYWEILTFKSKWLLHVSPGLTLKYSTFLKYILICPVSFLLLTDITSLCNIFSLVFIMEAHCLL
jgi:hypothetical protein